jgi:hypothetical protein
VRVLLVGESKNQSPAYSERTRRVVVSPRNWGQIFVVAVAFVAIAMFMSAARSARSDDEQAAKAKEAAAQSAKAAKAFHAIMHSPDSRIDFSWKV